jgi:hypothetical protein
MIHVLNSTFNSLTNLVLVCMIHGEVVLIIVIVLYALMQSFDFSTQSLCLLSPALQYSTIIVTSNGIAFCYLIKENLIVTTAQYNIQYS